MISIIVLALWLKTRKKNTKNLKRCVVECCTDSTRDVVFFLFFFKESTNLSDGFFNSSRRQKGIKRPANHCRCLMIKKKKSPSAMTYFLNKLFVEAAFDSNSFSKFTARKEKSFYCVEGTV